ncbi:hypothetical protein [Streptomyces sp. NPDC046925]|uniref:hypothetical protein n=1 Tax=Streptomyces sp. NPDC046925 TaxID=3155375 RepID=UPI0033C7B19B
MTYGFFTTDSRVPNALPEFLSQAFGVLICETDVSDFSELESRNWNALVTCDYERLEGDLAWSLIIYATAQVRQRLSEGELAALLAQRLDAPVFFSSACGLPWIKQVAEPGAASRWRVSSMRTPAPRA